MVHYKMHLYFRKFFHRLSMKTTNSPASCRSRGRTRDRSLSNCPSSKRATMRSTISSRTRKSRSGSCGRSSSPEPESRSSLLWAPRPAWLPSKACTTNWRCRYIRSSAQIREYQMLCKSSSIFK